MSIKSNTKESSPFRIKPRHHISTSHLPLITELFPFNNTFNATPTYSLATLQKKKSCNSFSNNRTSSKIKSKKGKCGKEELNESTQPSVQRAKELIMLENRLLCMENMEKEDKYKLALAICEEFLFLNNSANTFVLLFKQITEDYVNDLKINSEEAVTSKAEMQETKQTLQILSKRFKKIAQENAELKKSLQKKDDEFSKLKQEFKTEWAELQEAIFEKDNLINSLSKNMEGIIEKLETTQKELENSKKKVEVYESFVSEIQAQKPDIKGIKEKLRNINEIIESQETAHVFNFSSVREFNPEDLTQLDIHRSISFLTISQSFDLSPS